MAAFTTQKKAKEIMGKNYIGIRWEMRFFGGSLLAWVWARLALVPFSADQLREKKETHVLLWIPKVSLRDMRCHKLIEEAFHGYLGDWFYDQKFAKAKTKPGWYLVRKTAAKLVDLKDEAVPSAALLVYGVLASRISGKDPLFPDEWLCTSDVDSDGRTVVVGKSRGTRCGVYSFWTDTGRTNMAFASAFAPS